jgi:hypothetical protein
MTKVERCCAISDAQNEEKLREKHPSRLEMTKVERCCAVSVTVFLL